MEARKRREEEERIKQMDEASRLSDESLRAERLEARIKIKSWKKERMHDLDLPEINIRKDLAEVQRSTKDLHCD